MKGKILNLLLVISSLFGYLQWGKQEHLFLFQAEAEILGKLFTDPVSVLHPFTILPLAGQVLLLITLFQKQPSKALTIAGMAGVALLFLFMLLAGILGKNIAVLLSTLPFLGIAVLTIMNLKKRKAS